MKITSAFCAALLGASILAGGSATADQRCPPAQAAAGACAPVHRVGDHRSRGGEYRQRGYNDGYRNARGRNGDRNIYNSGRSKVPPPSDMAMDNKEGYAHSYGYERFPTRSNRRYDPNDGRYDRNERRHDRRDYNRYDQRNRTSNNGDVVDFANDILRGLTD